MSAFSGPQASGAARERRAVKRREAEARNALTTPERRKSYRLGSPEHRLLVDLFTGTTT